MASALIRTPKLFDAVSDDFESWIKLFERFLIANNMDRSKVENTHRCLAILHSCLGLQTFSLLENLVSLWTVHWQLIVGAIFMICVLFFPAGIWGTLIARRKR